MSTSRVDVRDRFPEVTAEIRRRILLALYAAAEEARRVADARANSPKPIARVTIVAPRAVEDGFAAGVKVGPLVRIFDRGSLGKHEGRLKRPGKPSWEVNRGANPYSAHRGDTDGEGVAPRHVVAEARKAGRAVLVRRLLSR